MKAREIIAAIEAVAPLNLQEGFDNAGIQVGNPDSDVTGCLVCLDITPAVIDEAIGLGYNMVVSHHPILFSGLKRIVGTSHVDQCVIKAIRNDIILYSAHTNLDKAHGGINYRIGEKLGLQNLQTLCPEGVPDNRIGLGVVGDLPKPQSIFDFFHCVKERLGVACLRHTPTPDRITRRVALCGGSGAEFYSKAQAAGADLYLTAELKYHLFYEGTESFAMADFGHYESEYVTNELFFEIITDKIRNFAVRISKTNINPIKYL